MTEHEAYQKYDDMLNELSPIKIGSIEYDTAKALKAVDPIAYNVGFSDFLDSEGIELE